MERAEANVAGPSFFEGNEFRYHINNLCGIQDFVYRGSIYHCGCEGTKKKEEVFQTSSLF